MTERKPARKSPPSASKRAAAVSEATGGFAEEERAAMRERAQELKAARRSGANAASDESAVLAKLAAMAPPDRAVGERLHAIIRASAPDLAPKLWYGMPAYARDGKVVCFFQDAQKFKTRYSTLGFSDQATLDEGPMWPTTFALQELTADVEARIAALVRQAVGA
jgi:uncharacterized protein YdhG (YjbR/CyaY superfamily)